jgi:hypothetical protein
MPVPAPRFVLTGYLLGTSASFGVATGLGGPRSKCVSFSRVLPSSYRQTGPTHTGGR